MNSCPSCSHDLVNIFYGVPSLRLIEMAKTENVALGGPRTAEKTSTLYCYGCNETF